MEKDCIREKLISIIKDIPLVPGCYIFRDKYGTILYVGKSKKLRNRVQSYFRKNNNLTARLDLMVKQIFDIEFIVTDNESESLTLESNLIKENQPHFNVLLKDDKKYPYLCITWSEDYPRIFITRRRRNRNVGDRYYGPFVDVTQLRKTLFLIKKLFPIRQRDRPVYKDRACLNYSIGRCPGVCQEYINKEDYHKIMKKISMIFQGRNEELRELLQNQMKLLSDKFEYEKAAFIRDQILGLETLVEEQKMIIPDSAINRDVIAIVTTERIACAQLFQMRAGKLCGRLGFTSESDKNTPEKILQTIIENYYSNVDPIEIPKDILVNVELPDQEIISNWLSDTKKSKVKITNPKRYSKLEIVRLVSRNAEIELNRLKLGEEENICALEDVADILEISQRPRRIEAYDISHIQGSYAVGSQVVFIDGIPAKQHYRRYKIKSTSISDGHSDDYMALSEVIRRRFRKWSEAKKQGLDIHDININSKTTLHTAGYNDWPDLLLIDGGKGQLSSVIEVLRELDLNNELITCSLAKKREEIFMPYNRNPLDTTINQPGMKLLRRLRDEAHRFAIDYHRKLRKNNMNRSRLSDIPGIGNKMIKALFDHFNSIEAIQMAELSEISKVEGLGRVKAKIIWDYFHQE